MNINITIPKLDDFKRALQKAPKIAAIELQKAINLSAILIERQSKINAPYKTGYLKSSHHTMFAPLKATIRPEAEYAIYVHEGTRYMHARPFLADAIDEKEKDIEYLFTKAYDNVINKIAEDTNR